MPVIDHMWQTETGGPIFGNPYGIGILPIKPGSAGVPLPGIEAAIVAPDGRPCRSAEKGIMVMRRPFPGLIATLWGEPERYEADYWTRIPGSYYVGDAAHIDEDGYVWFAGRADEIIKIAAHRLGTIEVETAFLRHPAVAEAGVTGRPDDLRGEVIAAFIVLRPGSSRPRAMRTELLATLRDELGPIAVVGELSFVDMLPKTRSGKIMRRVLKVGGRGRGPGRHHDHRGRGLRRGGPGGAGGVARLAAVAPLPGQGRSRPARRLPFRAMRAHRHAARP